MRGLLRSDPTARTEYPAGCVYVPEILAVLTGSSGTDSIRTSPSLIGNWAVAAPVKFSLRASTSTPNWIAVR